MPTYCLIGRDGSEGAEGRKRHREAHLAGLETLTAEGRVRFAGPLRDAEGTPVGSVVIFDAASLEEARATAAADPYVVEGVFGSHEVFETLPVFQR